MRTHLRLSAAVLVVSAALSFRADAQAECRRPPPREFKQGEFVLVTEVAKFPCKIEFVTTSLALRSDADPAITGFSQHVARGPDGRMYTSSSRDAGVHVWSADGKFIRVLGRQGTALGEFAAGQKAFEFGADGRIYIADLNRRWSVFGPTLEFERTIGANATGLGAVNTTLLTSDGVLVSSGQNVAQTGRAFGVFDFAPTADGQPRVVRQFGTPIARTTRIVTPSTGLNFWAATRDGAGVAYELELWRTDGTLLRTVFRDVPWFPKAAGEPSPEMEILSEDGTGIIIAGLMVPNAEKFTAARAETDPVKRRALQESAIEIYLEAIDGNAGVVLASWGPFRPSEAMKTLPSGLFPRSKMGYRMEKEPNGVSVVRIVELRLVGQ